MGVVHGDLRIDYHEDERELDVDPLVRPSSDSLRRSGGVPTSWLGPIPLASRRLDDALALAYESIPA